MMSVEGFLQCYNKGCGQKFKEEENHDSACTHHPGSPVFHDALKGWSCCPKRTTDFTDFLNIPGCTVGRHDPVKPPEPEKQKAEPLKVGEEIVVRAPLPKAKATSTRPPDDLPFTPLRVNVAGSLKRELARLRKQEEEEKAKSTATQAKEEPREGEEVEIGAPCKNKGCQATYSGPESNFEQCLYHSGFPIFHEGYKFWSCCQRRTSDFNEFLRQEGCKTGDHLWIEYVLHPKGLTTLAAVSGMVAILKTGEKTVVCRYDWHQTGSFVIISLFAKACLPEYCSFEANPTNVHISVSFLNGKSEHQQHLRLHGVIEPDRSSVELLGTKAEIKLRKADPFSWPSLKLVEPKCTEEK